MNPQFHNEDRIWFFTVKHIPTQPSKKLDYHRSDPLTITHEVNPGVNFHLELLTTMSIHPVFHVFLFKAYNKSHILDRILLSPPLIEAGHEVEYKIEEKL